MSEREDVVRGMLSVARLFDADERFPDPPLAAAIRKWSDEYRLPQEDWDGELADPMLPQV